MTVENKTANHSNRISLRTAALISGIAILIMAIAAPYAEMYVYPKLVVAGNAAETAGNILANKQFFASGIMGYLVTFIADVVASWSLYILLKPVNKHLSLLASGFRIVYTVIALVALLNLATVLRLLNAGDYLAAFGPDQLHAQLRFSFIAFRSQWTFGLIFFGIHLGLLGYLVLKSKYIPMVLGILLVISGLGYLASSLRPYLFPDFNLDVAKYTFYGELIFMLWLLIRGYRIREGAITTRKPGLGEA